MNIKNISKTTFKGTLLFDRPMKFSAKDSDVTSNNNIVYSEEQSKSIAENAKRIMEIPDDGEFFGLELNADNITFLTPGEVRYKVPSTNYEAVFLFNGDYKELNTQEYIRVLTAYNAAKIAEPNVIIQA